MKRIETICFILAIFLTTASIAWASLNYDSSHNYFLLDSLLKSEGKHIIVGDSFADVIKYSAMENRDAFFGVSNNLIFLDSVNGEFSSGQRQLDRNNMATPQISIFSNTNNFEISPIQASSLSLGNNPQLNLTMNQNFYAKSLTFNQDTSAINIADYTIYANRVLTNNLISPSNTILIPADTTITLDQNAPAGEVKATKIRWKDSDGTIKDFCQVITWNVNDDLANQTAEKQGFETDYDCPQTTNDGLACCSPGYLIFDINVHKIVGTNNFGQLVCCKPNLTTPPGF